MLTSNVKKIMKIKHVTMKSMSLKTGLSEDTINRARLGDISRFRLNTLETMANYLGCKVKDLFDES